ncbi:MAG: DMT family transporter [Pseudomonadota bacterium]
MTSDHLNKPLLGVGYALSAGLMLATMNMCAKLLTDIFNPIEITFYRNIVSIFFLISLVFLWKKISLLYKTKRPYAQLIRAVVGSTGMFFCIWAVLIMPLSVATAFIFTAPLFVTLLSPLILKEKVGIIRIVSTFIGFSGVLLIAQPETISEPWMILVGLAAGFFNGWVAICLRWLGSSEHTVTTNFYFFLYGTIMTVLLFPFSGISVPPVESYTIILGLGIAGLASLILKTQGFRYGPASLISPISYTMIIWAVLFDYIFWQTTPTIYTLLGSSVIIGSNLFIIWREHRKNQEHLIEA